MIGTSDDQVFESENHMLLADSYQHQHDAPPAKKDQDRVPQGPEVPGQFNLPIPGSQPVLKSDKFSIDNTHHVPLAASALTDEEGNPYGVAIDHRAPRKPEYDPYIRLHEFSELFHMRNLIKNGMSPTDAYHEAHDHIATPMESNAVKADLGEEGLEHYKQYWKDVAEMASEPSDRDRHPDAHTTRYKLDEGEGVYPKIAMAGEGDLPNLFTGMPAEPSDASPEEHAHNKALKDQEDVQSKGGGVSLKPLRGGKSYELKYSVHAGDEAVGRLSFSNWGGGHYYLSGAYGKGSNQLGPSVVRKAFREFIKLNPDATRISAIRVSGARRAAHADSNIDFDVKDGRMVLYKSALPDPLNYELSQARFFDDPLRDRSGAFIPNDAPLAERGPAQFRNAMRRIGVHPSHYEGQEEIQNVMDRGLPVSRPGPESLRRLKKTLSEQ